MIEKSVINEIQNFTATGYRSDLFNQFVKAVPYDSEMGRTEVEDYP
jgi:hypothetical protein